MFAIVYFTYRTIVTYPLSIFKLFVLFFKKGLFYINTYAWYPFQPINTSIFDVKIRLIIPEKH